MKIHVGADSSPMALVSATLIRIMRQSRPRQPELRSGGIAFGIANAAENSQRPRPVIRPLPTTHAKTPTPKARLWQPFLWLLLPLMWMSPLAAENAATQPQAQAEPTGAEVDAEESGDEDTSALPAEEREAAAAAVARPVPADPVQVFGWREKIRIQEIDQDFHAKLDTGALTSSIHAEEIKLFERDGAKWVRFIATAPREEHAKRIPVEAPLVRYALIKEVGAESSRREVVRLNIRIGSRSLRGEFTLANRSNMLVPVLIGRTMLRELGWVDPSRTYLADKEIFR